MRRALVIVLVLAGAAGAQEHKLTKAPKLVKFVDAVRPAGKDAEAADVVLSIEIDDKGAVGNVTVVTPAGPDWDAAAVAAAKQFVFEPAEIDGAPAPVKITYKYAFTIKEEIVKLGPQVNLEGTVKERLKKVPMAGVKVRVKDLNLETTTGEDGHFEFIDVPAGTHSIELSGDKLVTVATDEDIVQGKKKTVTYLVDEKEEGVDEEEVVRAPRIKKESVETSIRTEEARRVPGTQGDTLKVVQNLPGVARSSFGSGQLIVWGSAPKDTKVYVGGVEIPALYHGGGLRSTFNSDLVKSIDLSPGAYGADFGRGLGGLVKVEPRKLPEQGTHGYAAADFIDASGMVSAAPARNVSLALAGRKSYLDRTLQGVTSNDVGDFVPIPKYYDAQAVATLSLRRDDDVSVIGLVSDDKLRRTVTSSDPSEMRAEDTHVGFWRALVRWTAILEDGSSFTFTPSIGHDLSDTTATFGAVPTTLDVGSWRYAARGAYRRKLAKSATLSLGLDVSGSTTDVSRHGSLSLPAREGDVTVFGQPPGDDVNADDWRTTIVGVAPYVFTELTLGRLGLVPGLRVEPTVIDGSRLQPVAGTMPSFGYRRLEWAIDPRLSATFRATSRLSLRAGGGIYHQAPDPETLSAVFGNPTLGLSRAIHVSVGGAYKLTGTLTLEIVGFGKKLDHLAARSESPTPPLARALDGDGEGRSYGGQVLLRQELVKGFFGWITYSLIRSERRDHPDQSWRLFDYDQTHVLGVLVSYQIGGGWEAGARFRYATGVPRTPVVDAYYDARDDRYQPIFGAQNSIRIPAFYQLDCRIEKIITRRAFRMNVFLDVQNVTNRKNPEEIVYSPDYTERGTISGLPTLAVLGARLEF